MAFGYQGKVLKIDLSEQRFSIEKPAKDFYRKYLGGSALGVYYLLREMPPKCDPFSPQNTLVLALSVLTGVPISGQSRMTAAAKSPLTETVGDSQCGGFWPAEMKFSGFDALVIKGKAPSPLYLYLHDGEVEFRDASSLWGKETGEVESRIRKELQDPKVEVLQCGPSGEKRVRFASLLNMCCRANGRTGMGAVMASKNLRAVAVRGRKYPSLADEKALRELSRWGIKNLDESAVLPISLLGTAEVIPYQNSTGGLPSENYNSGVFEAYEEICAEKLNAKLVKRRTTCFACALRCKREVEIKEGAYRVEPRFGAPEYETIATFGSYCLVSDLEAIAKANEICNRYGMDTITCGATIAWAMECFEKGIINLHDTGGIDLRFGNAEAMVRMTEMIARREGMGDLLAEGSYRASEIIGRGSEEFLITVKKKELPAHMPQVKRSLGLIYAVNAFGPDHQSSEHDESYHPESAYLERLAELGLTRPRMPWVLDEEKVRFAFRTQCLYSLFDTLNLCQFVFGPSWQLYGPSQVVELVRAVTGWDVTLEELLKAGERRLNLLRAFNFREGIGREKDYLPKKLFRPLRGGPTHGVALKEEELKRAVDVYYEMAGWEVQSGAPTREKLEELGLKWVAEMLFSKGN